MTTTPRIETQGLKKSFGTKTVLDGIDLKVAAGESLVVIGGSGTGKSVLLKCIIGLMAPDAGRVLIDGAEGTKATRAATLARFGMLFQGGALFDSLPVWENVAFGLIQSRKATRAEAKEIAVETLGKVGLSADVAKLMPAELSGGMQKRVGLARAIATRPEIIFFDEPTTGLDPIMSDVINDLIRASVTDLGATAVTITHDMTSARKIADRVAMLNAGRLVWQGPIADLDHSGNPYVEQFINGRADGPIAVAGR